jgi:hypothetical protein
VLTTLGIRSLIVALGLGSLIVPGPATAQIACTEVALRTAINAATTGSTITIPGGCTITLTGLADDNGNLSGDLDIAANTAASTLTIQGAGPGQTIIDGGAVDRVFFIASSKTVTLSGLTIRNGDATKNVGERKGGGIFSNGATLTVTNSEIIDNKATSGGGIYENAGRLTLTNVTVSGNSATVSEGGGLVLDFNPDTLTNVTISGNSANTSGGGIHQIAGSVTLNNVTIANNSAVLGAGGLNAGGASAVTMTNTLIGGNTAPSKPDCSGALTTSSYNLIQNNTGGCTGTTGTDHIGVDPKIDPLADNGGGLQTHALRSDSPAINAGVGCPSTDERGVARPQGVACDIGAFEFVPPVVIQVTLAVTLNQTHYVAGDLLAMNLTATNSASSAAVVDAYLGIILPASAGPGLGCPAGDAIAFVTSGFAGIAIKCQSAAPSSFPRVVSSASVPAGTTVVNSFFATVLPPGIPTGSYAAFLALTPPNAFADDTIDAGDLAALGVAGFTVP